MSRLQCRGSIAGAVFVVALLSSRAADAQIGVDPGPPENLEAGVMTWSPGVYYDVLNQAFAEHHLQKVQAKLRSDAERGDMAAVDHDVRRIERLQYRIAIDDWLIRWNSRQYPDFYPIYTDDVSAAAIAQASHPVQVPNPQARPGLTRGPMVAATATIPITIVNAEQTGAGVVFAIDGLTHQAPAGSRQDLKVARDSHITFDSGGAPGQRRYRIPAGRYEFRSTAEGWALYKLPGTP